MSARSFVRDLGIAASVLATACSTTHKPEADPARLVPIMKAMDKNTPAPAGAPVCKPDQMVGGATMTQVTLLKIASEPANEGPERDDCSQIGIHPPSTWMAATSTTPRPVMIRPVFQLP